MWIKLTTIDGTGATFQKKTVMINTENVAFATPSMTDDDRTVIQFTGNEDNYIIVNESFETVRRALILGN